MSNFLSEAELFWKNCLAKQLHQQLSCMDGKEKWGKELG